jgi:dTMP kinase
MKSGYNREMKVYFGASISLDRSLLPNYTEIVADLKKLGHNVLSEYVVDPNLKTGAGLSPKELFARETEAINKADVMIAEVTSPSWGTAFLIEHALASGKPVLALYYKEAEMPLPMMIEGHPELYVAHYSKGNIRTILKKNLEYFVSMNHRKGKLVVIDGTDGSGKGTQTELLLKYLDEHKKKNKYIDFPRYYTSFHGRMVGRYLKGEFGSLQSASPYLTSLFYALDRLTARDEIIDWLEEGNTVVANRYTTSSMAFQTARVEKDKQEEFVKWLYDMEYKEHKLPKEDVVLFLYVPVEISQKLLEQKNKRDYMGGKQKDINEADAKYQKDVLKLYLDLAKKHPHWEVIKCVDAKGKLLAIPKVHAKVIAALKKHGIV